MDLRYARNLDGFCLVSSDSDFTKLASRLRESGKTVYGFGEPKTPRSLVAACDKFVYLDVLRSSEEPERLSEKAPAPMAPARKSAGELRSDNKLLKLLREGINAALSESSRSSAKPGKGCGCVRSRRVRRPRKRQPRNLRPENPNHRRGKSAPRCNCVEFG